MRSFTQRRRARRERDFPTGELQLAAMVDMMINLLLFLLNLYGSGSAAVQPSKDLSFARSTEVAPVRYASSLVVTRTEVLVDGHVVGDWPAAGRVPDETEVDAVRSALRALVKPDRPGELLVQVDHRVPWEVLSPTLSVAGEVGFSDVRFVVSSTTAATP